MLVGVVSDTHDNVRAAERANEVFKQEGVGIVIHLGDYVAPFTFRKIFAGFENRGYGVLGNNDGEKLLLKKAADEMSVVLKDHPYIISLDGKRILVLHGFGSPENTLEIVRSLHYSARYDVILYGHTHKMLYERSSSSLLLNPGEAAGVLYGRSTVAVVDTSSLEARFVDLF
jgi:putative phosphoesterase